jgi:gamma-tubulin complex component 4
VEEAELFLQLKLMKDFFLLGRGELFLEFIQQAGPILQNPPISSSTKGKSRGLNPLWFMGCSSFHISTYSTCKTSCIIKEKPEIGGFDNTEENIWTQGRGK